MASFGLLKVTHFNLEARINPGYAVLFCQRTKKKQEVHGKTKKQKAVGSKRRASGRKLKGEKKK